MANITKWGILATGGISQSSFLAKAGRSIANINFKSIEFAKDIQIDPKTREVQDIIHQIVAVGSSSGLDRAQDFVKEHCNNDPNVKAYGNYKDFLADENIQIVYIGTPHSEHWANARDCILAGKHVLCEKACTVNAKQAQALVDLAKKHNVFFMEAVWTRFFPITYQVQKYIEDGTIGRITSTNAQLGMSIDLDNMSGEHRLINQKRAGGTILDLGPYTWVWTAMSVLHPWLKSNNTLPADAPIPLPEICSMMDFSDEALTNKCEGKIDVSHSSILKFPMPQLPAYAHEQGAAGHVISTMQTSFKTRTTNERCVVIQGTKGYINVPFPPFRPQEFTVKSWESAKAMSDANGDNPTFEKRHTQDFPGGIFGFAWEADACARCIKDGKLESERMPWRETVLQMAVFDKIREQNGFKYPDSMEDTPMSS